LNRAIEVVAVTAKHKKQIAVFPFPLTMYYLVPKEVKLLSQMFVSLAVPAMNSNQMSQKPPIPSPDKSWEHPNCAFFIQGAHFAGALRLQNEHLLPNFVSGLGGGRTQSPLLPLLLWWSLPPPPATRKIGMRPKSYPCFTRVSSNGQNSLPGVRTAQELKD
jgi:hypothetical protein